MEVPHLINVRAFVNLRLEAMFSRHGQAMEYVATYVLVLGCLVLVWCAHPGTLYVGRDGNLSLWLVRMHAEWGSPGWLTLLNPFQGMGSMMLPINPWWNPASLFAVHWAKSPVGLILSFIAYHVEFTASVVLLGRCLGFSGRYAFIASVWLTVLLFPPFNYLFGLQAWLGTAPIYAHTLALGNAMASILLCLGKKTIDSGKPVPVMHNIALVALLPIALAAYFVAAPLYNAGMLVGYTILFGGIVVATPGIGTRAWQCLALFTGCVLMWSLGVADFLQGIFLMSGRFAHEAKSLLSLLEVSSIQGLGPETWEAVRRGLCSWGVVCDRFPRGFALSGSVWLHLLIVLGGVLMAIGESGRLARLGAVFAATWAALLLYWVALNLHILQAGPVAPLYAYLPLYPVLGMLSLYPARALAETMEKFVAPGPGAWMWDIRHSASGLVIVVVLCGVMAWWVAGYDAIRDVVTNWPRSVRDTSRLVEWPTTSPLTEVLRREIAIEPGSPFRGSVATILGLNDDASQGQLKPGTNASAPKDFQTFLDRVKAATGNSHALLDLWWFSIPTLEEYGQAISLPLRAYTSRILSSPRDTVSISFALAKRIEPEVLQILGVRFVLTDGKMPAADAALRGEIPIGDSGFLRLYELHAPNLGGLSPTEIVTGKNAEEILAAIASRPNELRRKAFAEFQAPADLVPARSARMTFVRGGVNVSAESDGTSALLLPLQFSNCLSVSGGEGREAVRLIRANLLHTLFIFKGSVDVTIRWRYGFGQSSGCRLKDFNELQRLELKV